MKTLPGTWKLKDKRFWELLIKRVIFIFIPYGIITFTLLL